MTPMRSPLWLEIPGVFFSPAFPLSYAEYVGPTPMLQGACQMPGDDAVNLSFSKGSAFQERSAPLNQVFIWETKHPSQGACLFSWTRLPSSFPVAFYRFLPHLCLAKRWGWNPPLTSPLLLTVLCPFPSFSSSDFTMLASSNVTVRMNMDFSANTQ